MHSRKVLSSARLVFSVSIVVTLLSLSALKLRASETVGTPQTGAMGVTESVESLMARQRIEDSAPASHASFRKPFLRQNRSALRKNPGSPAEVSSRSAVEVAPRSPQTPGLSFTGSTIADKLLTPPDSMGAVGPTQFIVTVNNRFRSFDKKTGQADGVIDLDPDVFFASVKTPVGGNVFRCGTSDPHVRFDRISGRWIIVMIDTPEDGSFNLLANRTMIAVSSGGTITGTGSFTFFQFQGETSDFSDFPTPGVDANAVYIGFNVFSTASGNPFVNCTAHVVNKASLLGAGPIVVTSFHNLLAAGSFEGPYTPQGVDNFDPAATEGYFIGVSGQSEGELVIRRIGTPGGTPTMSGDLVLNVPLTAPPLTVPSLGSSTPVDASDERLLAAHLRNGQLWTAHCIGVAINGSAAGTITRDGARWYQIQNLTSTPTLFQSGTVFDAAASAPKFFSFPTVMVSGQGHVAMGFTTAGANNYFNAGTVGRLATDVLGTMQTPVDYTNSSTSYTLYFGADRWGDYSFTSVDPSDDMTMWTVQEFCNDTNSYGVQVVRLLAPPPAMPFSCSPSSVTIPASNVNVVLTGTSSSGSGFFDPGAGFTNHIAAAVGGTGVTVNSVTYTDPTHLTLNLNFAANAASGARTITVTNPDGQVVASASGILTVVNPPPVFSSPPSATPNPAGVAQTIAFSAAATDPNGDALAYVWNFGDGSAGAAGASVTHAYSAPGHYTATVGVTDGITLVSMLVEVTVNAPLVGTGNDSDGDGFSDAFENSVGTDPNDAASTPTGSPLTAAGLQPLTISKALIKLHFARPGHDSITFSGTLKIPAGFNPAGALAYVDLGGIAKRLTLNAEGHARSGHDELKLALKSKNGVIAAQTARYSATFKKGTFAATLSASGLTNANAKDAPVTVKFTLIAANAVFQKSQSMSYSAKAGRIGRAK